VPSAVRPLVISGTLPLVLVAPHGGRRDPVRKPWSAGGVRVNDLHTAALTAALAAATGAAALINDAEDRNDVDLNRIGEAEAQAPWFLERLGELIDTAIARHGRATLLTIHGWNVIQPAVDLGIGCRMGPGSFALGPGAAISPAFAATALPALVDACGARGIAATIGARYPARHRENLVQLFTPRHREDPRPLVRALAARASLVDAVQLELGIPLRWMGRWRDALVDACLGVLPMLVAPPADAAAPQARIVPEMDGSWPGPLRLEFTSSRLCGLVGFETERARLLLFLPEGGLVLFTGERTTEPPGRVAGLSVTPVGDRGIGVRFRGPLLRFPDTTPFLDLECGLAGATLVDADVWLDFRPEASEGFGTVSGHVRLDAADVAVEGQGFVETEGPSGPWPRLRAALRLSARERLHLTIGLGDASARGVLHRGAERVPVLAARADLGPPEAPLDHFVLDVDLNDGAHLRLVAAAVHRLPVVRVRGATAIRVEFAACRLEGADEPAGWCEVGGL